MNIIDNNSFLTKLAADETADEWQIPENLGAETPLDQNQIENFLSNFNIDATTIEKHSDQFVGLNGQELVALFNRNDDNILSKDEVLSVIFDVSDDESETSALDVIFTGEGENRTLDPVAFKAFVKTTDAGLTDIEIDDLIEYFTSSNMTPEQIIAALSD